MSPLCCAMISFSFRHDILQSLPYLQLPAIQASCLSVPLPRCLPHPASDAASLTGCSPSMAACISSGQLIHLCVISSSFIACAVCSSSIPPAMTLSNVYARRSRPIKQPALPRALISAVLAFSLASASLSLHRSHPGCRLKRCLRC